MAVTLALLIGSRCALAGSKLVGQIDATGLNYIEGLTFDDILPGQPVVGAGTGASLLRLDPDNAHTLQTYPLPATNTTRALDYIGGGNYYQTRNQPNALYVVNPAGGTVTRIGTDLGGGVFNFLDTALDPTTGRLWALTDRNGGELYEIDRATGVASFRASITGLAQLVSIAIDPQGHFFISNSSGNFSTPNQIFALDPVTFQTNAITTTGYLASDFVRDFAFDPSSRQWYGLIEQRSASPRAWLLVQLTGVPEPTGATLCVVGLGASTNHRRRRRRRLEGTACAV